MKHPYAEILHAIADGKRMQRENLSEVWVGQSADETLWEIYDGIYSLDSYRIHPDDVEPVAEESSVAQLISQLEAERAARQTAQRQLADLQELQAKSGLAHRKSVQEAVAEAVKSEREVWQKLCQELADQLREHGDIDGAEIVESLLDQISGRAKP